MLRHFTPYDGEMLLELVEIAGRLASKGHVAHDGRAGILAELDQV